MYEWAPATPRIVSFFHLALIPVGCMFGGIDLHTDMRTLEPTMQERAVLQALHLHTMEPTMQEWAVLHPFWLHSYRPSSCTLFTTTFNMGEDKTNSAKWQIAPIYLWAK